MSRLIRTIFLIITALFTLGGKLYAEENSVKIVSMNLHCLHDDWQTRFDHIIDEIVEINPEVISFQEVCKYNDKNGVSYINEALAKRGWTIKSSARKFTHISFDKYREYVYIVSRVEASDKVEEELPYSPLQRSFVGLKINGTWYICLHLEYSSEWAEYRAKQIHYLATKYTGKSFVLMGDWNSNAVDPEQRELRDLGYTSFFPDLSYPSDDPEISIDGFWFSPEFSSSLDDAEASIILDSPIFGSLFPSDHYGIKINTQ